MAVSLPTAVGAEPPVAGSEGSTLLREPLVTPQEIGDGTAADLLYADPTEGLSQVAPPEGNSMGSAQLEYPLVLPKGRGMTPQLALTYESGGGSSWVGLGWGLSVGDIGVDSQWGVPLFCPRETGPKCDTVESESYLLDGEALMPSAVRSGFLPRIAEREDFTRRVETEYQRIIRHGNDPENYFWEVVDKQGAIRWYGGYPDEGGPVGAKGSRGEGDAFRNDRARNPSAILTDGPGNTGNGYRWFLSAERDVGVNMFRYQYDTVTYQSKPTDSGTGWDEIPDGQACASGRTCAKHVYLHKILYTGAGEASGHEEDPAYEVVFNRGTKHRSDPVLDARGGFLDLDQERLTSIEVRYRKPDQLVTRYDLHYGNPDRFGKSRLLSVTQVGCAGAGAPECDASTGAEHTFSYFDDVETAGSGFAAPVAWDAVGDNLDDGHQVRRASALGMAETNGGDGHVYLGFNPTAPSKTGSFGGSITLNGGDTKSFVEFLDINGDTLPDKVFRQGNALKYRLNTSRPSDEADDPITFSGPGTIAGLDSVTDKLPTETAFGISGGIEAYFGIFGVFNVGGAWSFANSYFTDANADGLPDFVSGGTVLFNHLDCSGGPPTNLCVPTFSAQDTNTRVPLTVTTVAQTDESATQALQRLRELAPPVDTVRRWVAPFGGTVTITGTATLLAPPTPGDVPGTDPVLDRVRVAIQHNHTETDGEELDDATLAGVGATWSPSLTETVAKGDRIYFRAGSRSNGGGDDVQWEPTITYTDTTIASAALDVNGLRQHLYKASEDFTLAGRPGSVVSLPQGGTAHYSAAIEKGATTDDVEPRLQVLPRAGGNPRRTDVEIVPITAAGILDSPRVKSVAEDNGEWCVTDPSGGDFGCYATEAAAEARLLYIGAAEVGRFRLSAHFHVDPVSNQKADAVQTWLGVDSPIDVQKISWVEQPQLCYPTAGMCDATKPIVNPPVDVDIYPRNSLTAPAAPWESTRGEVEEVVVKLDVGANNKAGNVVLTIKDEDGYVYKEPFTVGGSASARTFTTGDETVDPDNPKLPGVDLTSGKKYWFDLSVRNVGLSDKLSNARVELKWTEEEDGEEVTKSVSPPVTLNWVGQAGYFPVAYRGWALAGYRAEVPRATSVINEPDFRPGPEGGGTFEDEDEACAAQPGGCKEDNDDWGQDDIEAMGFDDHPVDEGMPKFDVSSATDQIPEAFAYVPTLSRTLQESWQVVDTTPRLLGTATTSRASRLGDLPPPIGLGGTGLSPPSLWGASGPTFSIMGGVGPLSGAFAFGWSSSVIDYMDMNGDGFPDVVTPDKITYTNPRGGRSCIKASATIACDGSGATVVQQSTTLGVSVGLGGAPLGISSNTKGRTNATQGNSGNKGGSASDKSYGGDLGLDLGFSASWTNPNAADPSWQSQVKEEQQAEVPGSPEGLATEQVLADLNGDGLPDRIQVEPSGVFVRFNLGHGFSANRVKWTAGGLESAESYSGSVGGGLGFSGPFYDFSGGVSSAAGVDFPRYAWADVNGDGLLDALHKNEPDHVVDVSFGTGTGVVGESPYGTMASLPFDIFPGVETDLSGQQIRQDQARSLGGGVDVTIGFPLCAVACYLIVNPGGHFENSLSMTDIDLQDVNGDGALDSVSRVAPDDDDNLEQFNHEQFNVRLNTLGRTGLLKQVETPMGGKIMLDYERRGNTPEYPESTWVLKDVLVRSSLATASLNDRVSDQRSTFEYGKPRYAFVQREDLGFDRVVENQLNESGTTLRSIEHIYRNSSVFDSGLEVRTTVYTGPVADDKKVQRTETDWRVLNLMTNLPLSLDGVDADALLRLRAAPQIARATQTWYDAGGNVGQESSIRYTYDRLGNPIEIDDEGDPTNPEDDVVATIRYSDCTISESYELQIESGGCSDGFPAPDPTDPDTAEEVPEKPTPAAHAPYWSKDLCSTWTSVPAIIEVRDADGNPLRYRDGAPAVCDNTSVTFLKQMVEEGPSLDDSTYAVTQLTYDDWGSYNRIVYPEDGQGRSYGVFYVYDEKRTADVARVTDLSLDADQAAEFLDPTALGALTDEITDSQTTITVTENVLTGPPDVPMVIAIGDEELRVTTRTLIGDPEDRTYEYTVERGVNSPALPEPPTNADHEAGSDIAVVTEQPVGDPIDPDQERLVNMLGAAGDAGITSTATFDGPTGRVSSRKDASGNVTEYAYDPLSRTKRVTYPDGGFVAFEYAPTDDEYPYAVAHNSDEFNADPIDTATFVDGSGRVTGQKRDATFFVGPNQAAVTGWAVAGAKKFDALGRIVTEWYPTKQLTGALADYWDKTPPEPSTPPAPPVPGGILPMTTEWDTLDRIVLEVASNESETKTTYGFGSLDGRRMATTEILDAEGHKTVTHRDVRDYTRAVDDVASGLDDVRTRYDFDALGQLHRVRSSPTEVIGHEYDLVGQRLSTSTPDGGLVTYAYDLAGNLKSKQTPVLREDDEEAVISYRYEFGHLVAIEYPDDTPDVGFAWGGYSGVGAGDNGAGRIVDVVDGARHQELGYDQNGRVDHETTTMRGRHPNRGPFTTSFDHDWLGRLASVTLPDAETVTNDYDAGGRLSKVGGSKACTDLGSLSAAIDGVQTTITVTENPTAGVPALPFTIWIGDEQLQVTARVATADPSRWTYTVVRGINSTADVLTNVPHSAGAGVRTEATLTCLYRYLDRREYDEFGSRAFQAVGNRVTTRYTRNVETRHLEEQVTTSPAAPFEIQDLRYSYDLVGNVLTAANELPTDVPSLFGGPSRQRYEYDTRYRIEHAEGTWDYAPKTRRHYTYDVGYEDGSGNTTFARQRDWTIDTACKRNCKESVQAATTYDHSAISYSDDAAHQYDVVGASPASAREYEYDADGNVSRVETATDIREVTWDAADKMTQVVDHNKSGSGRKVTSYAYDYNGELALEVKEQGQSSFVNPWVTVRNSTMWKHIWADTDRLATKFSQDDSYEQKIYYLHKDLQGSTNVATDRVGKVFQHHEYFPSGEVWVDEASTIFRTPYQFAGGYVDEDHDLVGMGQRWYEPRVQAFNSVDPILTDDPLAIVTEPELRLSYAYARNNPLTYVDVDGTVFKPVHPHFMQNADALMLQLKIDGKPLDAGQQAKLRKFFLRNQGLRGRMAMYWLARQEKNEKRQKTADLLDGKPVLEFEFENGKLNKIKLGFGVGKRKKLFERAAPSNTQPQSTPGKSGSTSSPTPANTPAPTTPATKAPAVSPGSAPSGPVSSGQSSAGAGGSAAPGGRARSKSAP